MSTASVLTKPLLGGSFGDDGRFALASMPCVRAGLHAVTFMVIDPRAGTVIAVGDGKPEVLADARRVIGAAGELAAANDGAMPRQGELWENLPVLPEPSTARPRVSRRRQAIHERTQGRCFYCSAPLQLAGPWHVEHQLPRALGGGDDALNLVASCTACNLRKSDRTAIEFVASAHGEMT